MIIIELRCYMEFDLPLLNISGGSDCQGLVKVQTSEESLGSQKFSFWLGEKGRILTKHGVQYMVVGNHFNIVYVFVM